jgi:hypothetical protein
VNNDATSLPPARRTRRILLATLAILGVVAAAGPVVAILKRVAAPVHGWQDIPGTFNGVVLVTAAGLPLAALTAWALALRRRAAGDPSAWRTAATDVGIVYGTAPWVWVTLIPGSGAGVVPGRLSLVPLQDLVTMGTGGIVGNLLVFAALGFLAPLRFAALASAPRVLALAAGCSVLIEVTQYVLRLDRVSSVDDVLLNAAGAGLAALASRRWWRSATCRVRIEKARRPGNALPGGLGA